MCWAVVSVPAESQQSSPVTPNLEARIIHPKHKAQSGSTQAISPRNATTTTTSRTVVAADERVAVLVLQLPVGILLLVVFWCV